MEVDGENWFTDEQEIQQMVIMRPGITYVFILVRFLFYIQCCFPSLKYYYLCTDISS